MLNYWRGWRRLIWHWHNNPQPLRVSYGKHDHELADCGRRFLFITLWRLTFGMSCRTIDEEKAEKRRWFKDDIWPTIIVEDALDADEVEPT